MKHILLLLFFCLFFIKLNAQNMSPKREFRGVWIATVTNIDWPTTKRLTSTKQKKDFVDLLEEHKLNGFNAVIVQIRPSSDAFYSSKLEPWSEWLTGTQGKAPEPYYDPLEFMIEACHQKGIEFHAWINPFRAVVSTKSQISESHIARKNPEWIVKYGKLQLLDPGIPDARQHVLKVIADIVTRYDVDGIHFDDYFYPYPVNGYTFEDEESYKQYNPDNFDKSTWRRDNINSFIKSTSETISSIKSHVKFGISPFGIWRNKSKDKIGSATQGLSSYDELYADSRSWIENGWIDYISPQIYWSRNYEIAKYDTLAPWWAKNSFGRHVYVGHSAYKVNNSTDKSWDDPSEIPNQVRLNRSIENIQGSVFFSSSSINKNPGHLRDSLREKLFPHHALLPIMHWKDSVRPERPRQFKEHHLPYLNRITWKQPGKAADYDQPYYYIVYRFLENEPIDISAPEKIRAILPFHQLSFVDSVKTNGDKYRYVVTALDRSQNESDINLQSHRKRLIADIVEVTLSPSVAYITRSAPIKLESGMTQIILDNLSPHLVSNSIQIQSNDNITVREIKHNIEYLDRPEIANDLKSYSDSLEFYDRKISRINDSLKVLKLMKGVLLENQKIGNVNNLNDVKQIIEYYGNTFYVIQKQISDLTNSRDELIAIGLAMKNQKEELDKRAKSAHSVLNIDISSNKSIDLNFEISYMVSNVDWLPEYDLKIEFDSTSCSLVYRAKIRQQTGVDWEEISLSLSSLDNNVAASNEDYHPTGDTLVLIKDKSSTFIPKVMLELGTTTITSNDEYHLFNISQTSIPVEFIYSISPSSYEEVRLAGLIPNWRTNNLLFGKVNLYKEGYYYDTTNFNIKPFSDTLKVQLGRESEVIYKKTEIERTEKRYLGVFHKHDRTYELVVENLKSDSINVNIEEVIPLSDGFGFWIKPEVGNAKYDPNTGKLVWNLILPPDESSVVRFGYKARFFKDKMGKLD